MAKSGDKKRLEENRAHVRMLQLLVGTSNLVFVGVRLLWKKGSTSWLHYAGLALTTVIYAISYGSIAKELAPHYNGAGELVYAGADLKTGGVLSYFHDLLYISAFVQLLGAVTDRAWLVFLLVPAFALYKLWIHVLYPYLNQPNLPDLPESAADKKRREKRERQTVRAEKFVRK